VGARYYLVQHDAKMAFEAVKRSGRQALPDHAEDMRWFDAPLTRGQLHREHGIAPRDDTWYAWWIDGAAPSGRWYRFSYLTIPDEEHLTFVPGTGITSFDYSHHGTVAEAHVRLIAYRRGPAR
jgi:hypothetical protein